MHISNIGIYASVYFNKIDLIEINYFYSIAESVKTNRFVRRINSHWQINIVNKSNKYLQKIYKQKSLENNKEKYSTK